jgi:hypothetical protein
LPGNEPATLWLPLVLLALPFLVLIVVPVLFWLGVPPPPKERPSPETRAALLAIFCGVCTWPVALLFLALRLPRDWRVWRMKQVGIACGLRLRTGLTDEERASLWRLPLFRLVGEDILTVSTWALEGRLADWQVTVFDLGYVCPVPGALRFYRAVQTVAVLSGPGLDLSFRCEPPRTVWNILKPGWTHMLGLSITRELKDEGVPLGVLHTTLDALVGALPPALNDELGRLGSRSVEGVPGLLMVYTHDRVVAADELHLLLEGVRRLAVAVAGPQHASPS